MIVKHTHTHRSRNTPTLVQQTTSDLKWDFQCPMFTSAHAHHKNVPTNIPFSAGNLYLHRRTLHTNACIRAQQWIRSTYHMRPKHRVARGGKSPLAHGDDHPYDHMRQAVRQPSPLDLDRAQHKQLRHRGQGHVDDGEGELEKKHPAY